ncbi:MAG: phosphotransferase [Oscillospiraceae bacterium]|nr:phosphotransferase [Oscillospiraceae bacterium]
MRHRLWLTPTASLLDAAGPPCLLHTDLWEGNVLLDRDTHAILALIDGDRAVYGDPDFEFASSWMDVPALLAGYGIDPSEDISPDRRKRRTLYRLFYALLEAYTPFEKYRDRSPYDNSTSHIKSLLAELDSL